MNREIVIDNAEDMCLLMCDNIIPRRRRNEKRDNSNRLRPVDKGEAESQGDVARGFVPNDSVK